MTGPAAREAPVFGARSLTVHLARGLMGFGALAVALRGHGAAGWPTLLLLGVAVWALKGCPVCWTIGLGETVVSLVRRRHPSLAGARHAAAPHSGG